MQLSLFPIEINWNEITTEWLFDYLKNHYPELKWEIDNNWVEEVVTKTKKVVCGFYIGTSNCDCWKNPILVHFDLHKTGGDYQGLGFAVDNLKDFEKSVYEIIEKYKIWAQ